MPDLIKDLRQNIRKLKPDGGDGFEGLVAAVLADLTKRSFALASAGSQYGKDGQSALDGGEILFEAKRYDGTVPKDKVYTKIFEIGSRTSGTELYVLAATSPISAQHVSTLNERTRELGVALLVLAWPESGLAELATLLAMAPAVSANFIASHTAISESELINQFSAVQAHPQFRDRSDELLAYLRQPSIAPAFAKNDNAMWLSEAFSDKNQARRVFGQALSPSDKSLSGIVDRVGLRNNLAKKIFAKPDDAVVAILGSDGNGKSWIFAQTWLHQLNPPLTIVIVPDDIKSPPSYEYCQDLLVSKLLTQTGDTLKAESRERWLKHFERWRNNPNLTSPRIVVFIDGINQRENVNWLRLIDIMSGRVAELGGKLVFSCRRYFYRDNIEGKLVSSITAIDIPEWTDLELDGLLRQWGTSITDLDASIVRSLRNPRIFGVAAALYRNEEISEFGELSVSRLLFEHIRSGSATEGAPVTPKRFAADICAHAENIVGRLKQQQSDINEFEMRTLSDHGWSSQTISEQFIITSAGRFFEILDENPNKYILRDEGLPLALGLALVRTAREACRKSKSVDEALSMILDPIAALDRTSDILLGAIISAVLEKSPRAIVAPLVRSFVMLQNLDASRYAEFRSLFAKAPDAFLSALEEATLTRDVASNAFWLTDAINDLRGNIVFEAALSEAIHRWLNMYSLSPERMVSVPNSQQHATEREEKLAERTQSLSEALASLSRPERDLLDTMVREDRGDYSRLNALAFRAMAGWPLAPYAESLRNWCFAASLNGGYWGRHADFDNLLHFNLADWAATKDAIREAAQLFYQSEVSRIGRWALVYVLRGTGDGSDAQEAEQIVEELTKDREPFKGWRLVESYCATDPCDPASEAPTNIGDTACHYKAISPAQLFLFRGYTREDHLFLAAQTGLARFRPEAAVEALRALADQVVTRTELDCRQAIYMLEGNTIALESRVASSYVEKARAIAQAALDSGEDTNDAAWITAQGALCIAFPHMSGDEQFNALLNHPRDKTILLDLGYLFQPIDGAKLEDALERAVRGGDSVAQFRILSFAEFSGTTLTTRVKELVLSLLVAQHDHVRLSALGLIQATCDSVLLEGLVNLGWNAADLDPVSHKVEIFQGSRALVSAAERGMISVESCLDRIALSAYESLATKLGVAASLAIAKRLTTAIHKAAEFQVTGNLPDIEQNFGGRYWPVLFGVSEKSSEDEAPKERFKRFAETEDAWYERQKRNQEVADSFERELTKVGARLIIQSVTVGLIKKIDESAPAFVDVWCAFFLSLDDKALRNVYNIASIVAEAISNRDAKSSTSLFERLRTVAPHVRVTFGQHRIGMDAVATWQAADSEEVTTLRFNRLDKLRNDHDLAIEVLAAVEAGRVNVLRDYVLDRRQRPEPAHRARAAMVAGLSPDESWARETIDLLKDEHGFLERAYQGSKYAMERHQWSRHWAALMRAAASPTDLWRYSVLLLKIVDGRFFSPGVDSRMSGPLLERFGSTLNRPINNRIRKWKTKRESKLFGMDIPENEFLPIR